MNFLQGMQIDEINVLNKSLIDSGQLSFTPRGLTKAFEAGEGTAATMTDMAQLTGGRAITVENIDTELKLMAEERKQLRWFNLLRKKPIYAVLDQYMVLTDHGTNARRHTFGKFRTEAAFPKTSDVTLERRVDSTKFVRDMRDLTHVAEVVKTYAEKHQIINRAGAITCLEAVELATIFGNSAMMPTQFDGLYTKLLNAFNAGATHAIVDCRATGSSSGSKGGTVTEDELDTGAERILNNLGVATHMLMPTKIKSDLNKILPVSRRVMLPAAQQAGARDMLLGQPAAGFYSDFAYSGWGGGGDPHFKFVPSIDIFYPSGESADVVAPIADFPNATDAPAQPTGVTAAAAASGALTSRFGAGDAGDYWYAVSAIDADGQSLATALAAAVTVAADQKVTLTVTCNDSIITGLSVYRSAMNAVDASDCRWIMDVAVTLAVGTTDVVDLNLILPGCSSAVLISNAPETDALDYRQLMPFIRMELPFGLNSIVGYPYLYMLYLYLRVQKLVNDRVGGTYHVLYTNVRWAESTF